MNFYTKSAQKYACERRTVLPYGEKKCYFLFVQYVHTDSRQHRFEKADSQVSDISNEIDVTGGDVAVSFLTANI